MNNTSTPIENWYRRIGKVSVGVVLFLILVGGVVRSTGSGMGCPDWPTCFGLLVPPTEVSEIPASFFVSHPEYESQVFNAVQTWIEYINRLIGALTGLVVLAAAALSLGFWRKDRRIVFLSVAALVLTGVEAWLGKLVVDKNLEGGMVTIHMLGAMLILATLITAVYLAQGKQVQAPDPASRPARIGWLGLGIVVLTMVQILVGTQVREGVDAAALELGADARDSWLSSLGMVYGIHKVLWVLVAGAIVYWVREMWALGLHGTTRFFAIVMLASLGLEILFGILLGYLDLPPVLQPLHLVLANVLFAAEYALLIYFSGFERLLASRRNNEKRISKLVNAE